MPRVLVVDDEAVITRTVRDVLAAAGYLVDAADGATSAIEALRRTTYDAALVDLGLPDGGGRAVVEHARELDRPPALLVMSIGADIASAVTTLGLAGDFVQKPVDGFELVARVELALERAGRRGTTVNRSNDERVVAGSGARAMRDALLLADKVAATPMASALLVGESGVGKEIIASRIHNASERRNGPFVRVNLAAISESVLEAELFGSVKGAFTDAKCDRPGYLATADGGTLLLDEIGEFRIGNQAKLLRVLEERRFFPVGSDRERAVNVRVLAATNRDAAAMLEEGLLRPDLFYRLGSVIQIPPLRDRPEEIVQLASHFVTLFCSEFGRRACRLTPAAEDLLESYAWPGNVRQLRNAIERAVMISEVEELHPGLFDLPAYTPPAPPSSSSLQPASQRGSREQELLHDSRRRAVATLERDQIASALEASNGSRSRAATMLGLSRSTLYERLKRYSIK